MFDNLALAVLVVGIVAYRVIWLLGREERRQSAALAGHESLQREPMPTSQMHMNPKGIIVLVAFGSLVALAVSSNGGAWFRVAEFVCTLIILAGLTGLLTLGQEPRK